MKLSDFNLRQCFFGEHLLPMFPDKCVAIVESKESALIAAHFMPEFVWLASGGCNGCLKNSAEALAGRDVLLVPDLDMTEKWQAIIPVLKPTCRSITVTDRLEKIASSEQREQGLDVADFLIEYATLPEPKTSARPIEEWTDQEVLDLWMSENPALKKMIEDFDMRLIPSG